MFKGDIQRVVDLIVKKTLMKRREVLSLIEKKVEEFEGLIDEYAAALMVAKELGIHISEKQKALVSPLKIKDLVHGLRNVTIYARVLNITPVKKYIVNGREVHVVKVLLADETGVIPLTLWNEEIELTKNLKPNSLIMITRATVKKFKQSLELSLTSNSEVKLLDEGAIELPSISELVPQEYERKTVIINVSEVLSSTYLRDGEKKRMVACLKGYDKKKGKRVRVIAWNSLAELFNNINRGDSVKVYNVKVLNTSAELDEYLLTKWTALEKLSKEDTDIKEEVLTPSAIKSQLKSIDIKGFIGYLEPKGLYKLRFMLHDLYNAVYIDFSSYSSLDILSKIYRDSNTVFPRRMYEIRVNDVDVIEMSDIPLLRANPWSTVTLTDKDFSYKYVRKLLLREIDGDFKVRATIIKTNLKIAIYDMLEGRVKYELQQDDDLKNSILIGSLWLLLEDGIDRAVAFTNSWKIIETLFNLSKSEALELACTPHILKEVIKYAGDELKGKEYIFSGFAINTLRKRKILILTDIEPINLSYEIKLLEEHRHKFEEV